MERLKVKCFEKSLPLDAPYNIAARVSKYSPIYKRVVISRPGLLPVKLKAAIDTLNLNTLLLLQLRVFKLAQSWPTLRLLLTIILSTLGALGYLTIILIIILYIFAVIGLQLFREKYTTEFFPDGVPRWNFTDIYHSLMMIFRVLCGEWIEPLWDCMTVADELCMVVFLPSLVIGYFIVSISFFSFT